MGQDTLTSYASYRVIRGCDSAREWSYSSSSVVSPNHRFRPALEILNPAALGADGLKTATYDMDGNGTLGSGSLAAATVVYTGDLTLPEITSANGFNYTGTGTGTLGWYAGTVFHQAGTSPALASGTILKVGREPGVPTTDAATPSITGQPAGATYAQNEPAAALSVTASITDNGTLSYQWYKNTGNSTTGGTAVGINSSNYTPPTDTVGTTWYYCVVTNTNPGATGNQTAAAASDTAAVTVNAPGTALVTGVSLNKATLSLYSNTAPNTATLIATVTPSDAANKTVAWQSGNIGAATVDASGKVTAVGNGTATITATTADGGYTASCTVTVTTYSGGGGSSGGDYTPPDTIVHNTIYPGASTIWLSGRGLSSGDLLIAKPLTSGGSYKALFTLADQDDVLGVYDISLRSGTTSIGSALNLTFNIGAKYAGQTLTLVHQKEDGGFEYFFATADASGNVKFGPLYSLSPFMLVKGTMLNTLRNEGTGIPKTGDNFNLLPFALLALAALCGAGTMVIRKRRTPRRYIAWCNRQIRHYDRELC